MCTTHHHSRNRAHQSARSERESGSDRVSDADREQTATTLQSALSHGLLDVSELEQRLERTWAARTRDDLAAVTKDLGTWIERQTPRARRSHETASVWSVVSHPIVLVGIVAAVIVGGTLTAAGAVWPVWLVLGVAPWMARRRRVHRGGVFRPSSGEQAGPVTAK